METTEKKKSGPKSKNLDVAVSVQFEEGDAKWIQDRAAALNVSSAEIVRRLVWRERGKEWFGI